MSSRTLSAVLQKKILLLCLNDFPCGNGSWRNTKDGSPEGPDTESTDALLDLLRGPHSPWHQDPESWSPQASSLRQQAVLTPERLHTDCIYDSFKTLRILDKGVSVMDNGLLKFSKLEELVLSANLISEIPVENLPETLKMLQYVDELTHKMFLLKILELRANRLSSLSSLTRRPPPQLQYLGLGSNSLGSREDVSHLTGQHWPKLVCLDLGDCEFEEQQSLMGALCTLPCLKTLVLEGNPISLSPAHPGFTVDSLPRLAWLDGSWISPDERFHFRGLAKMSDLIVDMASATVRVGRVRGIPDPLKGKASDFPVVSYKYFITYGFLSHHSPDDTKLDIESGPDTASTAQLTEDSGSGSDTDLPSNKNCERRTSTTDSGEMGVSTEGTCSDDARLSPQSTSKLIWSECMDFNYTQTHIVSSLRELKKFLNQGFHVRLEEEKVLSWPAEKDGQPAKENKGGKGKEASCLAKSAPTKDKSKDKKSKCVPELVHDPPTRRVLGSAHVPLQSLAEGGQKVNVLCDFGPLQTDSEALPKPHTDLGKTKKEEKKKEEKKEPKHNGGLQKASSASSKGNRKGSQQQDLDVTPAGSPAPIQLNAVTVELSVELEKWQSASEAHLLMLPKQSP